MKQMTRAPTTGFERHSRATRKAACLARLEALVPWAEFCALPEPRYPKAGHGRPPIGVERMLRAAPAGPSRSHLLAVANLYAIDFIGIFFTVYCCRTKRRCARALRARYTRRWS